MVRVPTLSSPNVAPEPLRAPQISQSIAQDTAVIGNALAGGVAALGQGIQRKQFAADDLAAKRGARELREARINLAINPETGYSVMQDQALIDSSESIEGQFDTIGKEILGRLTPRQQQIAEDLFAREREAFSTDFGVRLGTARQKVFEKEYVAEQESYANAAIIDAVSGLAVDQDGEMDTRRVDDEVALARQRAVDFALQNPALAGAALPDFEADPPEDGSEPQWVKAFADDEAKSFAQKMHTNVVGLLIDGEDPRAAEAYLKKYKGAMDSKAVYDAQTTITRMDRSALVSTIAESEAQATPINLSASDLAADGALSPALAVEDMLSRVDAQSDALGLDAGEKQGARKAALSVFEQNMRVQQAIQEDAYSRMLERVQAEGVTSIYDLSRSEANSFGALNAGQVAALEQAIAGRVSDQAEANVIAGVMSIIRNPNTESQARRAIKEAAPFIQKSSTLSLLNSIADAIENGSPSGLLNDTRSVGSRIDAVAESMYKGNATKQIQFSAAMMQTFALEVSRMSKEITPIEIDAILSRAISEEYVKAPSGLTVEFSGRLWEATWDEIDDYEISPDDWDRLVADVAASNQIPDERAVKEAYLAELRGVSFAPRDASLPLDIDLSLYRHPSERDDESLRRAKTVTGTWRNEFKIIPGSRTW